MGILPFFIFTQERGDLAMMNTGWIQAVSSLLVIFVLFGKKKSMT
jgi:hypothetical protein